MAMDTALLDMEQASANGAYADGDADGMGDMGERPLGLLSADALSLGGRDGNHRDDRSWSEFLRRQQDLVLESLWDFIRDHKPDSHEGRVVMHNVASAAIYTIMAQALQVKAQYEALEVRERKLKGELKKEEEEKVGEVFDRWAKGNSMQQYLACIKHRFGFAELEAREPAYEEDENGVAVPVTEGPRWDWHNADREMREADRQAIFDLPAKGYELYTVRQYMGRIRRQQDEVRARRMPDIDVSDWLAKIKGGKATNMEILVGGTYLIQELVVFGLSHEGGQNPHWIHLQKLYRGLQEQAAARRSGWFRRRQSMSDGDSGGDDA